jgi:hypothetical protein
LEVLNPQNQSHWRKIEKLPAGTLVTLYFKSTSAKRSRSQEELAIERLMAVFDVVQMESLPSFQTQTERKKPVLRTKPSSPVFQLKGQAGLPTKTLSMSFQMVVSKMDTFIHAGNAHLIVSHLSNYPGRVEMFVIRGKKSKVQVDADSIWGAEIRNGETIVFEFYGPKPAEEYVRALVNKANKYTQMDKVANE